MSTPIRTRVNKRTGEVAQSIDGGKTWTLVDDAPETERAPADLPDNPAQWSPDDRALAGKTLDAGGIANPWLPDAVQAYDSRPSKVTELPAVQIEGQAPADPEAGLWESVLEGAGDLGRGAAQGASFGLADEGAATLQSWLGSPLDGQRAAGRGVDAPLMTPQQERSAVRGEALADERSANATARERSPVLYTSGAVAGSLPAAIATAPVGGPGATLGMRAGQSALHGAALGTAAGYGASEAETDAELLEDSLRTGGAGAAMGAAGTYVGAGLGTAAQKGGEMLNAASAAAGRAGLRNRAAATGVYGGELAKMSRQRGRDIAERIGGAIEKYGAHRRPEGGLLPRWMPQSAGVYADTTEEAMKRAGQQMGSAVDDATAAGSVVDPRAISMRLRDQQAQHLAKNVPDEDAVAASIDEIAERLAAEQGGRAGGYTPREMFDKRLAMKGMAKLDSNRNVMPEATYKAQAYREGRDVYRDAMEESMGPEHAVRFREANEDYGLLKMANNASRQREAQELGNQMQSIYSPGMAAAGAAVTGVPGAAAGIGLTETVKRVGRDSMADVLGATSRALASPKLAATSPAALGQRAGFAGADLAAVTADDAADSILEQFLGGSPAAAQPTVPQTQAEAGTHPLMRAVDVSLRVSSGRDLGRYAPELEKALAAGPKEFGATMLRLQKDPEFVRTVMPVLNGFNQRNQGARR